MIMKRIFNIKYTNEGKTPSGEMNFIGATIEYFDKANQRVQDINKEAYIRDYENNIFPEIDRSIPIDEYDDIAVADLIHRIQLKHEFQDTTIESRVRNLFNKTIKTHAENVEAAKNFGWGRAISFTLENSDESDVESAKLRIRKSLTPEEEKKAFNLLVKDPSEQEGEEVGLTIMFLLGARNNEVVALNFGDLIEMVEHEGKYYAQIYETVTRNSSSLKAGGKTLNAPRNLPVMDVLAKYILKRKDFVSKNVSFPLVNAKGETYNNINELPIACKKDLYAERLNSNDLSKAGKEFLRNRMQMKERRVSGLSLCMVDDYGTDEYINEKDVTTYLFRRNMATRLYYLGLTISQCQYYMGHDIENTLLKRSDFSDEDFLYELFTLINEHPFNNSENGDVLFDGTQVSKNNISSAQIKIKTKKDKLVEVNIKSNEKHDQTVICLNNPKKCVVEVKNRACKNSFPDNTNIRKTINKIYSY